MRYLIVPFMIFVLSFLVLQFNRELQLRKGKTWLTIGKELLIALGAGVLTAAIMFVIVVFFN